MSHMDPYMEGGRRAIKIHYAYPNYAEGGIVEDDEDDGELIHEAEAVRQAGRHGDSVLVHVNPEEFERMRAEFGDPLINPETGIPEWGFFSSIKKALKKLAPILSVASFIPGLQALSPLALASKGVTAATGLTGAAANALGGGALGALTGGEKGAVTGALTGFATTPGNPMGDLGAKIPGMKDLSPETQSMVARGVLGGAGAALTDRDPLQGALGSVMLGGMADKIGNSEIVQKGLKGVLQNAALGGAKGVEIAGLTGADPVRGATIGATLGAADHAVQKLRGYARPNAAASQATPESPLAALSSGAMGATANLMISAPEFAQFKSKEDALQKFAADAESNPDQRPIYDALEKFTVCDLSNDFGGCMAQNWDAFMRSIRQNAPSLASMAEGGSVLEAIARSRVADSDFAHEGVVRGPGDGQSDSVPINAARDEYVLPADVVSSLGNGSSDAGAEALDRMVQTIRKQVRGAPAKKNPPKAKSPLAYLGE